MKVSRIDRLKTLLGNSLFCTASNQIGIDRRAFNLKREIIPKAKGKRQEAEGGIQFLTAFRPLPSFLIELSRLN